MTRYRLEQFLVAVLLSVGGLGVGAAIVLGGIIWRPAKRAES